MNEKYLDLAQQYSDGRLDWPGFRNAVMDLIEKERLEKGVGDGSQK